MPLCKHLTLHASRAAPWWSDDIRWGFTPKKMVRDLDAVAATLLALIFVTARGLDVSATGSGQKTRFKSPTLLSNLTSLLQVAVLAAVLALCLRQK